MRYLFRSILSRCLMGMLIIAGLMSFTQQTQAQVKLQTDAITSGGTSGASASGVTLHGSVGQIATSGSKNSINMLFNGLWAELYADEVITDIEEEEPRSGNLPEEFGLSSAYPNPFNPTTRIQYALPRTSHVTLSVYNMLGRRVQVLVDQQQQAGRYTERFSGKELSSGMYIYRLQAGSYSEMRKMMLVK